MLDNVRCNLNKATLLDCNVNLINHNQQNMCRHGGGAGVRCRVSQLNAISVAFVNTPCCIMRTAVISWELKNITIYRLNSFEVHCFNDKLQHSMEFSVDNETFTTTLGGLLPSATYYICCVSAVYGSFVADEICDLANETSESNLLTSSTPSPIENSGEFVGDLDNRTSIIGGVLGFIIAALLILLAICGGALLYLLASKR